MFAGTFRSSLGHGARAVPVSPFPNDLALVNEIIRQETALAAFAPQCPITADHLRKLQRHRVAGGAEHEVFIYKSHTRVWKQTNQGRWGFKRATPKDYLLRLSALTQYAGELDILVKGLALDEKGFPSIITSMAYVDGYHPQPLELADKLKNDGWELIGDSTGLLVYRHRTEGVILRDAHPGNFIVAAEGKYVPIDVAIEGF